jgi:N-acyl homoserine lactone hydrolase
MDDEAGGHGFVFAFDAADLKENVRDEKAVGGFVHCEAQDTLDSILKLKAVAARHGYPIFPGHDPEVWPQLLTTPVEQWAAAGA